MERGREREREREKKETEREKESALLPVYLFFISKMSKRPCKL